MQRAAGHSRRACAMAAGAALACELSDAADSGVEVEGAAKRGTLRVQEGGRLQWRSSAADQVLTLKLARIVGAFHRETGSKCPRFTRLLAALQTL